MPDLGPFFPPGTPTVTWEWDNPLAYFNLGALVASILVLRMLRDRRGESGLADGAWAASLVFAIGTGLHFVGDVIGVAESWDHQFIHLVVFVAILAFLIALRKDSGSNRPVAVAPSPAAVPPSAPTPARANPATRKSAVRKPPR